MNDTEEIKSRLNIVDIVGEYLKLIPAGANKKALCPFHNEKTPSFMVNEERQIFHCFGCGKGGDIFTFIQEIEGLDFPGALNLLAQKAGVTLKGYDKERIQIKNRIRDVIKEAVTFYQKSLITPAGKAARDYLKKRKVTPQLAKKFQLGFAPGNWQDLFRHLTGLGFSSEEIERAGLILKSGKSSTGFYDRFRRRLMFPIFNSAGDPIGFSGRVLPGDETPLGKYINSPQTELYDKSQALYGLHLAKTAIKKKDLCLMLEGNLDVILSHLAGVENVVATCGTAVTSQQLKIIQRYTNNLSFAFDVDQAGIEASKKGIDLALAQGLNVGAVNLKLAAKKGKDVADIVKSSPATWKKLAQKPKPAMEYYFEVILGRYNLKQVDQKKKAAEEILEKIALNKSRIDQDHYLNRLFEATGIKTEILYDLLNEKLAQKAWQSQEPAQSPSSSLGPSSALRKTSSGFPKASSKDPETRILNRLAGLLIFFPKLIKQENNARLEKHLQRLPQSPIKEILTLIITSQARFTNPNQYLELIKDERLKTRAARLITIAENHFSHYNEETSSNDFSPQIEFELCLEKIKQGAAKEKLAVLAAEIKAAEAGKNKSLLRRLIEKYNRLLKAKNS